MLRNVEWKLIEPSLSRFVWLRELNISGCRVTECMTPVLAGLRKLEKLVMHDCGQVPTLLFSLINSSTLRTLDMTACKVWFQTPDAVGLSALETLILSRCRFPEGHKDTFSVLHRIPNLRTLLLDSCGPILDYGSLLSISFCSQLRRLDLSNCWLDNCWCRTDLVDLDPLSSLVHLTDLDVTMCCCDRVLDGEFIGSSHNDFDLLFDSISTLLELRTVGVFQRSCIVAKEVPERITFVESIKK